MPRPILKFFSFNNYLTINRATTLERTLIKVMADSSTSWLQSMLNYCINGEKNMDLSPYLYGVFYVSLGIFLSIFTAKLLGKIKNSPGIKNSFYKREQTFTFQSDEDFNLHFYTLGLLSLVLIALSIFLFLWVVASESFSLFGFLPLLFLFGLFCLGYIYAWKKGLFE
jgi:NADH:ubiquinone oxidoreductase subunit 3 (subunit A)